jgi:uracil phosphoribosyltransferase
MGVLVPGDASALSRAHNVADPLVVSWRSLTVALLDRMAPLVRERLGVTAEQFPLARVLEGGTCRPRHCPRETDRRQPSSPHSQRRNGVLMQGVNIVDHPLVQHKLAIMRDKGTSTRTFRALLREMSTLLCYEVTRDLPLEDVRIDTPVTRMRAKRLAGKKLVFAPIMRAGLGMLDGMLELAPSARVAHIGLYREPKTLKAVEYYFKAPSDVAERLVIVIDPMLATGHTAVAAIDRLKETGVKDIRFVCVLAAPEGVDVLTGHHPDVQIWAAAVDERLDDRAYIVPGLGDAGDRMYGTK